MIQWVFNITHGPYENAVTYHPAANQTLQINETDIIQIEVKIGEEYFQFGEPYLVIGDVPIDLALHNIGEGYKKFITVKNSHFNKNQLFFNYFGESEIQLKFKDNHEVLEKVSVDIKARKANAELAKSMLTYISENEADLVSLCFSKSFLGGDFENKNQDNMHKFILLRDTVHYFLSKLGLFYRDYSHTIENKLYVSQQGQPTGPDSVYWLLQNLDKITPSNAEEAKLKIKNKNYNISEIPSERLIENTDVFENRVINSFLYSSRVFLFDLKKKYKNTPVLMSDEKIQTDDSNDFVSFDHILSFYKKSIINHHINDINLLLLKVDKLIHLNKRKLRTKLIPSLRPRVTPFVMQHPHYRYLFVEIDKWYNASTPNLDKNNILLGLRNLSSIYEITTLLMLSKDIPKIFDVELNNKVYRNYSENTSFEGEEVERPIDQINNYFGFSNDKFSIELLFEPKIYSYRKGVTKINDLINISNKSSTKYGEHYYLPDYVLRINNIAWKEPLVAILDAKYSDRKNVLKYSLQDTSEKYLHNLFQLKKSNVVGASPVKLMMILFAHGLDLPASFLNELHYVDGELPVYPQAVGIKYTPDVSKRASEWLSGCVNYHHKEQTKSFNN
jgi:hypothetical protein